MENSHLESLAGIIISEAKKKLISSEKSRFPEGYFVKMPNKKAAFVSKKGNKRAKYAKRYPKNEYQTRKEASRMVKKITEADLFNKTVFDGTAVVNIMVNDEKSDPTGAIIKKSLERWSTQSGIKFKVEKGIWK